MKTFKQLIFLACTIAFLHTNAQEKKIKFNKGTLKICSSKNFQIEGYDGDEVIIKSLHEKKNAYSNYVVGSYSGSGNGAKVTASSSAQSSSIHAKGVAIVNGNSSSLKRLDSSTVKGQVYFFNNDENRKKGLKKIGKKSQNSDLGIYFIIEQSEDELLFKDQAKNSFIMTPNEGYLIKIPNTIKLVWQTSNCREDKSNNQYRFFSSKVSTLSDFNGEVEITSTLNNMKLKDVSGPVVINTIGGNITVEFDQKYPKEIYSIYTNNGFIDIQIPKQSNILIDVIGKNIYSDVDFNVLEEEEVDDVWQKTNKMKLKYGSGKVKMKLNGGFGNVYLRKK